MTELESLGAWKEERLGHIVNFTTNLFQFEHEQEDSSKWLENVALSLKLTGWQQLVDRKSPRCQLWKMDKRLDEILSLSGSADSGPNGEVKDHMPEHTTCTLIVVPNTPASGVFKMFQDYKYREEWDRNTNRIEILEESEDETLLRYETLFPWPLNHREYVIATRKRRFAVKGLDCCVLYQRTVDSQVAVNGPKVGFVRAPYYEQVYIFRQHGDDAEVVQMFCHNAGVQMPGWIENKAVKRDFPVFIEQTIDALRKYLQFHRIVTQ